MSNDNLPPSSDEPPVAPPPVAPPQFATPPMGMPPGMPQRQPDLLESMIPTSNPDSLISYYLGLFSIMPLLGLPMSIVALVKGRKALLFTKEHGVKAGATHARVGIGCGSIGLLLNLAIVALLIALLITGGK